MQPNRSRPGSAKTQHTRITQDSDLHSSKFSETSGASSFHQKPDDFKQHLIKVNKDPKYKHLNPKLDVIPEKAPKPEERKPSYKPMLRKKNSDKPAQKIEEPPSTPPEEILNLSSGFAKKNKQKMNSLVMEQSKSQQDREAKEKTKAKINQTFKMTRPADKKQSKKEAKTVTARNQNQKNRPVSTKGQQKSPKKQVKVQKSREKEEDEQSLRQSQIKNLQRYINDVEARNMSAFPSQYDRMIRASPANTEDLEKIDLKNFMEEPTEEGYELMAFKIRQFDSQLGADESIDLDDLISGEPEKEEAFPDEQAKREEEDRESCLDSMSTSQLRDRNAFLTQILKGDKISKRELQELELKDESNLRLHRLQREKTQVKDDDEVELPAINMVKKQNHRVFERNRVEAAGEIYRDCDYLSPQHQQRLQEILDGDVGESPFEFDDLERMRRRCLDEGIHAYRGINNSPEIGDVLDPAILPKDPEARSQAEKRILQERIKDVNLRLVESSKATASKEKIQALIKKYEFTKRSEAFNELEKENQMKFEQNLRKLQEAEELVSQFEEKENLTDVLDEIESQYRELELEIEQWAKIDADKWRQMEGARLKRKLAEVEAVQAQYQDLERGISRMEGLKDELQEQISAFEETTNIQFPRMQCEGFTAGQSLDDIDQLITGKWQISETNPSEGTLQS